MTAVQATVEEFSQGAESGNAGGQYLTFMLAGEEYGIEILKVQEIKGWSSATPIPNTPEHVLGVLNLRGAVVPIVDLRKRFELESIEYCETTVVIVVKMQQSDQERTVGLVVDAVADVYRLESSDIQPPPDMGTAVHTEFVRGLATVNEKMVILLDVNHLIDFETVGPVGENSAEQCAAQAADH
ncbi:MAG: purine-binding chemotaxis protein CheW [Gammaproteobacteria bacterium]|nr:purine-binding chemotaxis protein CheW [Gammaproteobacteria bacterium]